MQAYVCIHGHFYQPLRENPWLEVVEVQDSAAPFHDWNQRISTECYAPNTAARIMGGQGRIDRIVNNYERISFNFGPTLMHWLAEFAPGVYDALIAADRTTADRWGSGGALAQVYHHIIMPLANQRDKQTQVLWGLRDFAHRYGRQAQGMWLAETAVDTETLECLADAGVAYTILAPEQCAAVRAPDQSAWQDVLGGRVDPLRPYKVKLPSGREMALIFYQSPISRAVAFEQLLNDGAAFARRVKGGLDQDRDEPQLLTLATDGESYGHHHRFGEMALAFALRQLEADPDVELINPASFLERHPPRWEARIVENSSWSCAHGVERWRSDCGCAVNPGNGWNQKWRAPLRQAMDWLRDQLAEQFERRAGELLQDPWAARDDYVSLMLDNSAEAREAFLDRHRQGELAPSEQVVVWKLLEAQRWGMAMFTSCAWFFDDIGGIEPIQNMRFAARAIQLAGELGAQGLTSRMRDILAKARSNVASKGTGAEIWQRKVTPARVGLNRVAAHAAMSGVVGEKPPPGRLFCYDLVSDEHWHQERLGVHLSWGSLRVAHRRLGQWTPVAYAALHNGGVDFMAWVNRPDAARLEGLGDEAAAPLKLLDTEALAALLDRRFDTHRRDLGDMFLEGRRSLARGALRATMRRHWETARSVYESSREMMLGLKRINVPLPPLYDALFAAMLSDELVRLVRPPAAGPLPERLGELARQARAMDLTLDAKRLRRALEERLAWELRQLAEAPSEADPLRRALGLMDLAEALEVSPDLWEPQNILYRLALDLGNDLPQPLLELGGKLNLDLSQETAAENDS